jgi:hypothetical protein
MGWLWNTTHDIFDIDDGTYPEICICGLTAKQVIEGYNFIRSKSGRLRGNPTVFSFEANQETALDEVINAAELVCSRHAQPFHFVVSSFRLGKGVLYDLGFFILDNAIAIDFKRGPLMGEREIETLLRIIIEIRRNAKESYLQLQSTVDPNFRGRIEEAIVNLIKEDEEE